MDALVEAFTLSPVAANAMSYFCGFVSALLLLATASSSGKSGQWS